MVKRVRFGGHQQSGSPHRPDDPRIVGPMESAVEILRERSADDQHDRPGDQPSAHRQGQAEQVEDNRGRQCGEQDRRTDLHQERTAPERFGPRMMVLEIVDQPLERRDLRHHPVTQRQIVFALARSGIMEHAVEADSRRAGPVVHVHVGQARDQVGGIPGGKGGRESSASPARPRTTGSAPATKRTAPSPARAQLSSSREDGPMAACRTCRTGLLTVFENRVYFKNGGDLRCFPKDR